MKKVALAIFFTTSIFCAFAQKATLVNQLSAKEKKEGWKLLFDGKTSNGWHLYNKGKIASAWVIKHGELICDPTILDAEREVS